MKSFKNLSSAFFALNISNTFDVALGQTMTILNDNREVVTISRTTGGSYLTEVL